MRAVGSGDVHAQQQKAGQQGWNEEALKPACLNLRAVLPGAL